MNSLIKINNTDIAVKEYGGKRVVTFKDVDAVHGRPDGTARKRFNDNKKHFVEGEDFFKVPYDWNNEHPIGGRSIFDAADEIEGFRGRDYGGFIYMAQDPNNGLWKIGRTASQKAVEKRLNLSRTNELKSYQYFNCVDTLQADKIIQEQLASYKVKNSWYDCSSDVIKQSIEKSISKVEATYEPRKRHKGGFHGEVTLITESGYLMLVKSFTDDLSWEVQRQLVNTYFRVQQGPQLSSIEMIAGIANHAVEMDRRQKQLEMKQAEQDAALADMNQRLTNTCEIISLDKNSWRQDTKHLITEIAATTGSGFDTMGDVYKEIYKAVESRAGVQLKTRQTNKRRRMAEEGVCKSKRDKVSLVDIIADDKKLIEIYIAIVKEMAVKYGVCK